MIEPAEMTTDLLAARAAAEPLRCRLIYGPPSLHLTQIFAGFALLERRGLVRTELEPKRERRTSFLRECTMEVVLDDSVRLVYDTHDFQSLDEGRLAGCDFYFKRSYLADAVAESISPSKVRPLGLNYPVYAHGDGALRIALRSLFRARSRAAAKRAVAALARSTRLSSALLGVNAGRWACASHRFEVPAGTPAEPRVVFLTRAWNPAAFRDRPAEQEARHQLNEMRVSCIRRLRDALGPVFVGGLADLPYARRAYSDCVVGSHRTRKRPYLDLMRGARVCVTTTGLYASTGWKLGEYVAAARAIVTEPLRCEVPGDFRPEKSYVPFETADDCAEVVVDLMADANRVGRLMLNNRTYYESYLRPDCLVWRTLRAALLEPVPHHRVGD